ncbi:MAG TPA: gliding motility-associated C-terminal domain-containing protein [Puia sp.]|nr:gliding motility-associated C-terminal domain-containing protein [Puia sp.]
MLIICLLTGLRAAAQTCTGGLGDPIAYITFGQGSGIGPPLAAGITNLTYHDADCPQDGYYTIINSTSGCAWHTVAHDHTGDANGYFMLINASFQPSDFYVQTVSGLCGNTSYQFGAWVLNVDNIPGQILPNITFRIEKTDGTVLQTYETGDIPETGSPTWNQYAFYFNTPPGVSSVVLRMTNNAPGGDGNDLALDDITFRPAGSSISSAVIGFPTDTLSLCINAQPTLDIDATVESCYPSQSVQWQESVDTGKTWTDIPNQTSTELSRTPSAGGMYLYRLTSAQSGNLGITTCEVASQPIEVNVIPTPNPAISIALASDTNCAGSPVTINATVTDPGTGPFYQWLVDGAVVNSSNGGGLPPLTSSTLQNGQVITATMQSDAACLVGNGNATSNAIVVPIIPIPVTAVSIAASATQICADSVVVFTATAGNGGIDPHYQWQVNGVNAGGDSAVFEGAGLRNGDVVNVSMTADLVCSLPVNDPQGVAMTIYALPVISMDTGIVIAGGSSVQLLPAVTGNIASFSWTPATGIEDAGSMTPVVKPVGTTAYTLQVVTTDGCKASATEDVEVFYDVRMPAAFTPNGDGHNDIFRVPPSIPVVIRQFAVYNRQGEMVFYTTNVGQGWDGTSRGHPQPAGTYVWFVEYNDPVTRAVGEKQGAVVLIR